MSAIEISKTFMQEEAATFVGKSVARTVGSCGVGLDRLVAMVWALNTKGLLCAKFRLRRAFSPVVATRVRGHGG